MLDRSVSNLTYYLWGVFLFIYSLRNSKSEHMFCARLFEGMQNTIKHSCNPIQSLGQVRKIECTYLVAHIQTIIKDHASEFSTLTLLHHCCHNHRPITHPASLTWTSVSPHSSSSSTQSLFYMATEWSFLNANLSCHFTFQAPSMTSPLFLVWRLKSIKYVQSLAWSVPYTRPTPSCSIGLVISRYQLLFGHQTSVYSTWKNPIDA